jgi:hypothetical protein
MFGYGSTDETKWRPVVRKIKKKSLKQKVKTDLPYLSFYKRKPETHIFFFALEITFFQSIKRTQYLIERKIRNKCFHSLRFRIGKTKLFSLRTDDIKCITFPDYGVFQDLLTKDQVT